MMKAKKISSGRPIFSTEWAGLLNTFCVKEDTQISKLVGQIGRLPRDEEVKVLVWVQTSIVELIFRGVSPGQVNFEIYEDKLSHLAWLTALVWVAIEADMPLHLDEAQAVSAWQLANVLQEMAVAAGST